MNGLCSILLLSFVAGCASNTVSRDFDDSKDFGGRVVKRELKRSLVFNTRVDGNRIAERSLTQGGDKVTPAEAK